MDFLKRELAPVTEAAWEALDKRARETLVQVMAARRVVDVKGPLGWGTHAVPLGTLGKSQKVGEVAFATREVLPLVELRVPFTMKTWDLDNITRGDVATDWSALDEAARSLALFEDETVFLGRSAVAMQGLVKASENKPIAYTAGNATSFVNALATGLRVLALKNVEGCTALVVNTDLWQFIATNIDQCRPLRKRIEEDLGLKIIVSHQVDVCALVSLRGGDFEMTVGQDVAIGYQSHTSTAVSFFFTESFACRVNGPEAVVSLEASHK